ncbi:MAG: GTPase [Acetobacteraceae bacterium]
MSRRRTVILGAAGRDFHVFNTVFRDDPSREVVAFTAAQIPGIAGRRYPPGLAGPLYPDGIPILPEEGLPQTLPRLAAEEVVFAYSDVPHAHVMHLASQALAAGADVRLCGPRATMLASRLPVVAVCAVRTGCGKSLVSREVAAFFRARGVRVAVIRHPMPYGDLAAQAVQRFATPADLDAAACTVEEREEYEPHIAAGSAVFSGVDMARVLAAAEAEAELILWDGGNNDFPFIRPDLLLVLADARRPGHESAYHPGEATLRMADAVLVAKADTVAPEALARHVEALRTLNPAAPILPFASRPVLDDPASVAGRRVLAIEDGPSLTHGGLPDGVAVAAAWAAGAAEILDPRPFAPPRISALFAACPHIGRALPAMGYAPEDLAAIADAIAASGADMVLSGTPADLARLVPARVPILRVRTAFADLAPPGLAGVLSGFAARIGR